MKRILMLLAFAAFWVPEVFARNLDQELYSLLKKEWDYQLKDNPEKATYVGAAGYNTIWTDLSPTAIDNRNRHQQEFLKELRDIPEQELTPEARQHRAIVQQSAEDIVARQQFSDDLISFNQLYGFQIELTQILSMQPHSNERDYRDHLERLRGLPRFLSQMQSMLDLGLAKGISTPQIALRDVQKQLENLAPKDCRKSELLKAFYEMPKSIGRAEQHVLRDEACQIFEQKVRPAFGTFISFFKDTYYPKARSTNGLDALPSGKAWYNALIRRYTTTTLSADEIHQIGLKEVARIETDMGALLKETQFKGDLNAFLTFLRNDPQFYMKSKSEVLTRYRDLCKRIDGDLLKIVSYPPRLPYGVFEVPAFNAKSQPVASYTVGSLKAGRAGRFFVNTYDLKAQPTWSMVPLALHETVPGHHLQMALADEMANVPDLIKYDQVIAFIEGWGLYAESLGEELGLYDDPYSHFGQLTYEMLRAVRLVADTGLHSKGWTRDQSIQYFMSKTGRTLHEATVEVDRYMVLPGQALAYKIGELKIKELRDLAQTDMDKKFDLREFHDVVLRQGPIPLTLLEKNVKDWIQIRTKK